MISSKPFSIIPVDKPSALLWPILKNLYYKDFFLQGFFPGKLNWLVSPFLDNSRGGGSLPREEIIKRLLIAKD